MPSALADTAPSPTTDSTATDNTTRSPAVSHDLRTTDPPTTTTRQDRRAVTAGQVPELIDAFVAAAPVRSLRERLRERRMVRQAGREQAAAQARLVHEVAHQHRLMASGVLHLR